MSKTSRSRINSKLVPFPKHLLIYQKPVSPLLRAKESKSISSTRYSTEGKTPNPGIKRGKTMTDENYNEEQYACLVTVERNYVKELLNSPTKYKSRSPIETKRSNSNVSPVKVQHWSKFENLTACDFLYLTSVSKLKRGKLSITPSPFYKKVK